MRKLFPILSIIAIALVFSAEAAGSTTLSVRVNSGGIRSYVVKDGSFSCLYPGCNRTYVHYHGDALVAKGGTQYYTNRHPYYYRNYHRRPYYYRPYNYRPYYYRRYYNPRYRRYYYRYPGTRSYYYRAPGLGNREYYYRTPGLDYRRYDYRRYHYRNRVPVYPHDKTGTYHYRLKIK